MRSCTLALVPVCLLAACAVPSFSIQPRYAQLELTGSAGISSGGVGAAADVEQAGIEQEETLTGRADLKFGSPHLVVLAQGPRFRGSGTLDVAVSDGTNTIVAGTPVDSEVDLDLYDAALVFDLVPGDTVEFGIGLGVAYIDLAMSFQDPGTSTTVATDEAFPVPLLAGVASVWLGPIQVGVFAGGVDYTYEDDSVHYLDADAFARWKFFGGDELLRGSLVLGYRRTDVDVQYDDAATTVDSDLSLSGPYFGLELSL